MASRAIDEKPKLPELNKYVKGAAADKWEELGWELGLADHDDGKMLDDISKKKNDDKERCFMEAMKQWMRGIGKKPVVWGTLIDGLKALGLNEAIKSVETYVLAKPTPIPMDMSTGQQEQAEPVITTPSIDYSLKFDPPKQIREYQKELAAPGINGENYIVVAPTGSGKTLVAGLVISNHLKKCEKPVVFVTHTRPLAQQQVIEIAQLIPAAFVQCCTGNDTTITIQDTLKVCNVVVCTAGKLMNEILQDNVKLYQIGLLVIDECHHVHRKSQEAQMLYRYLLEKGGENKDLPQIMGLTAAPGAGKNRHLDMSVTIEHLIELCALMDATSGIKVVEKHKAELYHYTTKATCSIEIPGDRECNDPFRAAIIKEMTELEKLIGFECISEKWSAGYLANVKKETEKLAKSDFQSRNSIRTLDLLHCYSAAVSVYMDMTGEVAIDVLNKFDILPSDEKADLFEHNLIERFNILKQGLIKLKGTPNPLLDKVERILCDHFETNHTAKGIFFVKTKQSSKLLCEWFSKNDLMSSNGIRPRVLMGTSSSGSKGDKMTQTEQELVIKSFREGECNLLVATSVAEEGLDIPACDLVIRFLMVTNEIAEKQATGRARAKDSKAFTILSTDKKQTIKAFKNYELAAMVDRVLADYMPRGIHFQHKFEEKQRKLIQDFNIQRMHELKRQRAYSNEIFAVKCKTCQIVACKSSDIYSMENAAHHVVADDDFRESMITKEEHRDPKVIAHSLRKTHKAYCANCGADWGVLCELIQTQGTVVILKSVGFVFDNGTRKEIAPKWNRAPFRILPLSERPQVEDPEDDMECDDE